jgi:hypothetical protein
MNYAESGVITLVALGDMNGGKKPALVIADRGIVIRLQDPLNPAQFLPPGCHRL